MALEYGTIRDPSELQQILELQACNLPASLGGEEKAREGFVTVVHSRELLEKMNRVSPHIVARDGELVVGYALCMHPEFSGDVPVLIPMFHELRTLNVPEHFMVMGQICVARQYRGTGVFRQLYETMKREVFPAFQAIITEVDAANTRSLNAHLAVGFRVLRKYHSGERDWHVLLLERQDET